MKRHIALIVLSSVLMANQVIAGTANDELMAAVRRGDLAAAKSAIDKGADVNTKTSYGLTPLFFAAERGHADVVALLIENKADVNVKDTFYGFTALMAAAEKEHREVVRLMLNAGADGADNLLKGAVGEGNVDAVKMLLETKKPTKAALSSSLSIAESMRKEEIRDLLKAAGAEPEPATPAVTVSEELLKLYSGTYKSPTIGLQITFTPAEGVLKGVVPGQPTFTYRPTAEHTFEAVEIAGINVTFKVADAKCPQIVVEQGGGTFPFDRIDEAGGDADKNKAASASSASRAEVDESAAIYKPGPITTPRNWPSFRGPIASGVSDGQGVVAKWDTESNKNIAWKTPIPGLAHSGPIVWGDRVFVTTAVSKDEKPLFRHGLYGEVDFVKDEPSHAWRVYALDRRTGAVVWDRTAHEGVPKTKRHTKASQANCTPATDGTHVVVSFGSEGLYCYDFDGKLLWKKDLGILDAGWFFDPDYQWGFGSSPIIYKNMVILQCDVQESPFIAAFSLKDGSKLWHTSRDEIPSWGTPTVIEGPTRVELIANGSRRIRGYDPLTGKELWSLTPNSEVTIPTPIIAHDLIYITSGYRPVQPIYAIRLGATGDISLKEDVESNEYIAWSKKRGGPYHPTPIVYGEHLYTCNDQGILTCYNARTGDQIYRTRIAEGKAGGFTASPVASDGKLFFTSEDGEIYVVKAGSEYQLLAVNKMGEVCMSTPAVSNGLLVVRAQNHVFGIGLPELVTGKP